MTATILDLVAEPILIDGMTWREFKVAEQLLDRPGVRLSFLNGILEIRKMPGKKHETLKKRVAALLEVYLEFAGIDFTPTGSMTLENETGLVKREADESYELGPDRDKPDIVIEVTVTSGGINKLEAYQRLSIPEVWFWENKRLSLYTLRSSKYEEVTQSEQLPGLDMGLLVQCINLENHIQAVREFRQALLARS